MLATKLKNKFKLVIMWILIIVYVAAVYVTNQYVGWYYTSDEQQRKEYQDIVTSQEFLVDFIEMPYVLYNYSGNSEVVESALNEQLNNIKMSYDSFYPYVSYTALDEHGEVIKSMSSGETYVLADNNLAPYQTAVVVRYYETGVPYVTLKKGDFTDEQSAVLKDIANYRDDLHKDYSVEVYDENGILKAVTLKAPKNCEFVIAMTPGKQELYIDDQWGYNDTHYPATLRQNAFIIALIVAAFAWILPLVKSMQTGNERVFKVPFEIPALVMLFVMNRVIAFSWSRLMETYGLAGKNDILMWMGAFLVVYWASGCLRPIYELGVKRYLKERTLTGIYGNKVFKFLKDGWKRIRNWFVSIYHSLEQIDFTQKNDKNLLKLVLVNLLILTIICMMWVIGIIALIVYSVVLFIVLRKFYHSVQEKYAVLLYATNEIAEGNLDREINEDLGIFNPFKKEITKIQRGFKNAVEKEVKSQRMKTELITNVSHDLKTPLTAIITYINLLKDEKDEEKKQEYIEVLDKKSLRLKVLIEDLFEISKASSKNVSLHILDVDIVSLFKQVKIETEEKFERTGLDFRCNYPEEPLFVPLDSQKTYRIFENLLVNIAKYAMPNTRVYVDIRREGERAVVCMKNISAAELKFDVNEITERFVRGDEARNTKGSGLGLAIAKSFTEVQKGELKIETDGDLFKVEVRFEMK